MKRKISTYLIISVFAWCLSCSVQAPEVKVTGEKSALENQVIGTYEQIEEDTWMVASVRSTGQKQEKKVSPEQKRILEAMKNRQFNKDDIDELKRDGAIGESMRGFLEIRPHERLNSDPVYSKRVTDLIAEENRDRETVMNRIAESSTNASKEEVYSIMARYNFEKAEPGTWIQLDSGEWVKKK
ncbi:DUF1318 domain-containing protein [candidate division KSB1 bacterium]|nr:DUF1318 domain-containing protein [candidate division KSB1 bacterium]